MPSRMEALRLVEDADQPAGSTHSNARGGRPDLEEWESGRGEWTLGPVCAWGLGTCTAESPPSSSPRFIEHTLELEANFARMNRALAQLAETQRRLGFPSSHPEQPELPEIDLQMLNEEVNCADSKLKVPDEEALPESVVAKIMEELDSESERSIEETPEEEPARSWSISGSVAPEIQVEVHVQPDAVVVAPPLRGIKRKRDGNSTAADQAPDLAQTERPTRRLRRDASMLLVGAAVTYAALAYI